MSASEYESYYAIISRIPAGRVMTYAEVARAAGRAGSARRVGYALAACANRDLPWWRVINARGQVSRSNGRTMGADEQEHRLRREGITMDASGTIDLACYRFIIDSGEAENLFREMRTTHDDPAT